MKKIIIVALLSVVLIGGLTYFICFKKNATGNKFGYVYTDKVFSDYKGTKLVEAKLIKQQQQEKHELDSLKAVIQILESSITGSPSEQQKIQIQTKRNEYMRLLKQYESENNTEFQQAQQALWVQINQYMKEYGKEEGFTFIHGANGTGNLMYADTTYNVTQPVIKYINQQFDGKH